MAWRWPDEAEPIEGASQQPSAAYQWPAEADPIPARAAPEMGPGPGPSGPPIRDDEARSIPTLREAYRTISEPVTSAVSTLAQNTPMAILAKYLTGATDDTMQSGSRQAAEFMVPQSPTGAAASLGSLALGPLGPLGRILGAAGGAAAGSAGEGNDLATAGKDAALYGGGGALGEGVSSVGSKLLRSLPWLKGLINEGVSSGVSDVARTVNPALGPAIEGARSGLAPTLRGGKTAAALQETALGQGGKRALGDAFEQGMLDTTLAAQGQGVQSRALQTAWDLLPTGNVLADKLKNSLAPSPSGTFSPQQAERLLAELGEAAFKGEAASPIARGISGLELRKLYGQAVNETTGGLPQAAGDIMGTTRRQFAGGNAIMEGLREPQAFQGLPNRVMLNTPAVGQYLSANRAELESKLGVDGFQALKNAILSEGQVGTRDILTPGSGSPLAALAQVYGRGQGGAPQIIGSAVRTALPNLGSEYTGRAPLSLDPGLQALFTFLSQRAMEQAQGGRPVQLGEIPGR